MPIRLATKSVRSRELIGAVLAAGPFMQGLLCYSAAEAAWLAERGFDDIVVAYPTVEPTTCARWPRSSGTAARSR